MQWDCDAYKYVYYMCIIFGKKPNTQARLRINVAELFDVSERLLLFIIINIINIMVLIYYLHVYNMSDCVTQTKIVLTECNYCIHRWFHRTRSVRRLRCVVGNHHDHRSRCQKVGGIYLIILNKI